MGIDALTRIVLSYQSGYTLCNEQVMLLAAVIAHIRYIHFINELHEASSPSETSPLYVTLG